MQKNRYTIPNHPDKIVFSQSWISNFFECPLKFKLAGENTINWDSVAMRKGNVFERIVLGDFDGKLSEYSWGKTAKGQIEIAAAAKDFLENHCKHEPSKGSVQLELVHDLGRFGLGGAIDHKGLLLDDGEFINDLKYCDNPPRSDFYNPFNEHTTIKESLQAIVYTYLVYKNTGKILPFKRIVVSPLGEGCKVWVKIFNVGMASFDWLERKLNEIYDAYIMGLTYPCDETDEPYNSPCYSRKGGTCKYLAFCEVGQSRIYQDTSVNVDEILGVEELTY